MAEPVRVTDPTPEPPPAKDVAELQARLRSGKMVHRWKRHNYVGKNYVFSLYAKESEDKFLVILPKER